MPRPRRLRPSFLPAACASPPSFDNALWSFFGTPVGSTPNGHRATVRWAGDRFVVAARRHLPDLPTLVRGLERRRDRRPPRHPLPARLPRGARGGCDLAVAHLPLADGRLRL